MSKIHLAPSILSADFTRLGEQLREAEAAGVSMFHIDVMDGRFVPNITMGALVVEACRRVTRLPLDVHLMIVEPDAHLRAFADAGADRITVHYEVCPHLHRTLQSIRAMGCKAGVALNPHTPATAVQEVIDMIDLLTVMTVNPGFGGQAFIPAVLSKIAALRAMIGTTQRPIDLEVDGGINTDTAMSAAQAGANVLIAGTAIFSTKFTVAEGINALRQSLDLTT